MIEHVDSGFSRLPERVEQTPHGWTISGIKRSMRQNQESAWIDHKIPPKLVNILPGSCDAVTLK